MLTLRYRGSTTVPVEAECLTPASLSTFHYECEYHPVFLSLYLRQLRAWGFPLREEWLRGPWRRFSGDLVALGKGEVLHWQAAAA